MSVAASWRQELRDLCKEDPAALCDPVPSWNNMPVPPPTELQQKLLAAAAMVRERLDVQHPEGVPSRDKLFFASSFEQVNTKNTTTATDTHETTSQRRGFCNWLIPGHLMIGQYPGQNPLWDGPSAAAVESHLQRMTRDARISVFCSLQSETPAQDDHSAWEQLPSQSQPQQATPSCGQCFLQPESIRRQLPRPFCQYAPLVERYCADNSNHHAAETEAPVFLHSPLADLSVPESQEPLQHLLLQLLECMNRNLDHNEESAAAIYIHCWGGRGRAGLVGACLLTLLWPHLSAQTILEWVQTAYETRLGHDQLAEEFAHSPQTRPQRAYVRAFCHEYQQLFQQHYCSQLQQQHKE